MEVRLGHTPDPDDAFMFYALLSGRVDTEGMTFHEVLETLNELNVRAEKGTYDMTALSVGTLPRVSKIYDVLTCGACMAEDKGPLLVFKKGAGLKKVAVPGEGTTACLALRIYKPDIEPVVMHVSTIMRAVASGQVEAGLLINEDMVLAGEKGLKAVDLGAFWKERTGLPLPLGIDAVRRGLPDGAKAAIARVFRRSIEYALEHEDEALNYARRYAGTRDAGMTGSFVRTFVGRRALDIGEEGKRAISVFLEHCENEGLVERGAELRFIDG